MNDHRALQQSLNDFVDDALPARQNAEVAAHLDTCDTCAAEVAFLLSLKEKAAELTREIVPVRDLWSGIADRLEPRASESAGVIPMSRASRRTPPAWRGWAAAAIAASVLVALTAGITAHLMRGPAQQVLPPVAVDGTSVRGDRAETSFAAFAPVQQEYLGTLETLEAELAARRGSLSPETRTIVDENLAIIDAAIVEISSALQADSTSVELPLLLSGVYRTKVELISNTLRLTTST